MTWKFHYSSKHTITNVVVCPNTCKAKKTSHCRKYHDSKWWILIKIECLINVQWSQLAKVQLIKSAEITKTTSYKLMHKQIAWNPQLRSYITMHVILMFQIRNVYSMNWQIFLCWIASDKIKWLSRSWKFYCTSFRHMASDRDETWSI